MATRFRNDLLDHGFLMIQFSVYARPCVNFEQLDKHIGIIQKLVPEAGNVRLLSSRMSSGAKAYGDRAELRQGNRAKTPKMPGQVEFWD